eukprot:1174898-Amphidinium_carterae.5
MGTIQHNWHLLEAFEFRFNSCHTYAQYSMALRVDVDQPFARKFQYMHAAQQAAATYISV